MDLTKREKKESRREALFAMREAETDIVSAQEELEESGRIVLNLSGSRSVHSSLAGEGEKILDGEIADYLERQAHPVAIRIPLEIELRGDPDSQTDRAEAEECIKNFYSSKVAEANRKIRNTFRLGIVMLIFGVLLMGLSVLFRQFDKIEFIGEILMIADWVFIWKAVECFFMERKRLQFEKLKYLQLYLAKLV